MRMWEFQADYSCPAPAPFIKRGHASAPFVTDGLEPERSLSSRGCADLAGRRSLPGSPTLSAIGRPRVRISRSGTKVNTV